MAHVFDENMPDGQTWRDLFDTVIVSANKPDFFSDDNRMYRSRQNDF